jgi:hypothetical protein
LPGECISTRTHDDGSSSSSWCWTSLTICVQIVSCFQNLVLKFIYLFIYFYLFIFNFPFQKKIIRIYTHPKKTKNKSCMSCNML